MAFKNEVRLQIAVGKNDYTVTATEQGYIGSIQFKYPAVATGDLTIQVIKKNLAGTSVVQTIANAQITACTDIVYTGASDRFTYGDTLRILTDIDATASVWVQFSDEKQPQSTWFAVANSDVAASSSSSSSSSVDSSSSSSSSSSESSSSSSSSERNSNSSWSDSSESSLSSSSTSESSGG